MHRYNRRLANQQFHTSSGDCQYGAGIGKASTEWAHLHIKMMRDYARFKKLSVTFIFTDIKTAFASAMRFLAFSELPECKEVFIAKLQAIGFGKQEIDDVLAEIESLDVWEVNGPYGHLKRMAMDVHTDNWLSIELCQKVLTTRSGVLAGTCWAA